MFLFQAWQMAYSSRICLMFAYVYAHKYTAGYIK